MVTYGLFTHGNEVWWCGPDFPNHTPEDEQRFTNYPVEVFLDCCDAQDGRGWGLDFVERHAKVLDSFLRNVGPGHEDYAVRVRVNNESDLLALVTECELLEEQPEPL